MEEKGKGTRLASERPKNSLKKGNAQWRMLLPRTSAAQLFRLCGRQVGTTACLLADPCPKWSQNAALISNLDQNCSHILFSAKLIFSLPPFWQAPDVCENPSVTDDGSPCWKRADYADKMLGLQAGDRLPSVVLCTGQHQGPTNTGGWICWQADYDTQTWVTAAVMATGAQEQERHRRQMFWF